MIFCAECDQSLAEGEPYVYVDSPFGDERIGKVAVHEHCADAEDAEAAIAAGEYDPSEAYPHGDF